MVYSLDGRIGGPDVPFDWEENDDEVGKLLHPELSTANKLLMGRELYQGFEQSWPAMGKDPNTPPALVDFANWIEDTEKIVFTSTLQEADWKNTTLINVKNDDDIAKEIAKLKQGSGGDFVVYGGVQFVQTLVKLRLIDEYRLKIQPVVLGRGALLFEKVEDRVNLKLVKAKFFDSGVVAVIYQPKYPATS